MSNKDENIEYNQLKIEIENKSERIFNINIGVITISSALITFSLEFDKPNLLYFVFMIIIALTFETLNNRKQIAKISTYIIVFIEKESKNLNWETLNFYTSSRSSKFLRYHRYYSSLALSIICLLIYLDFFFEKNLSIVELFYMLCLFSTEVFLIIRLNKLTEYKKEWIKKWENLRYIESKGEIEL